MSSHSWFSPRLLAWYSQHHRDLPWRRTRDPYRVWLSEVILQQTRVEQGLPYYERFVERFPTVKDLGAAREQEVLKLWQGLGYYSRARNLRAAARQVVTRHGGRFPRTHQDLLGLKGVGDYTASAIASICFDLPEPVVDGNVYRVLSRVFGIRSPIDSTPGRKEFRALAARLLDPAAPGDHNQAVMELGAVICTPRDPACDDCPLATRCLARRQGLIDLLPVKARRTSVRLRHFNYLLIEEHGSVRFTRRGANDIWHGLHELPLIETPSLASASTLKKLLRARGLERLAGPLDHVLTHQRIRAVLWKVEPNGAVFPRDWKPVKRTAIARLATHRLMEKLLAALG